MDSTSTGGNSNEVVTVAATQMPSSIRTTTEPLRKHDRRHATDKYWSGLFIFILIIWTVSRQYVIHHQTNLDVLTENGTVENKIPQFMSQDMDHYVSENDSVVKNISEFPHDNSYNGSDRVNNTTTEKKIRTFSEVLQFFFDTFTCNLSHMDAPNGRSLRNVHYAVGMFYYFFGSLVLLRSSTILQRQPSVIGVIFVYVALLEHLSITLFSNDPILSAPFHEKLSLWVIPEAMFLIIWLSRMFSGVRHKNSKNICLKRISRNKVNISDENSADDKAKDNFDLKILSFYHCIHIVVLIFPFIITLKVLMDSAISVAYTMGWNNVHSYIAVGGAYYLGLTVYNFGLMVISCTFAIASRTRSQCIYKSYASALFTVARYHFGTACFRATPIIPGLHVIYVTKEPSLDKPVRYIGIERYFITHLTYYKLMTTLTAVDGTNQSESIRNLIRLYCKRLFTKKSYLDFRSLSKSLFFFLLSINSLAIVTLAGFGTFDNRLSLATWVMYLKIVYIFNKAMGFITSISDTLEVLKLQSKLGDHTDEELRIGVFSWHFLKNEQSDDEENV